MNRSSDINKSKNNDTSKAEKESTPLSFAQMESKCYCCGKGDIRKNPRKNGLLTKLPINFYKKARKRIKMKLNAKKKSKKSDGQVFIVKWLN